VRSRLHQAKAELGARLLAESGTTPRGDAGWTHRVRASYRSLASRDPGPYVAMFAPGAGIAASGRVEIARVLRPGGRLFLEHVRDTDPKIACKQDHPVFLYSWIGCHPNRDTLTAISRAPFEVTAVRHGEVPKAPRVERPMIVGAAARCA